MSSYSNPHWWERIENWPLFIKAVTILPSIYVAFWCHVIFHGVDYWQRKDTNEDFPFYVKHHDKSFIINDVRKLFNSAGDLKAISEGYTHVVKGSEIVEMKNGEGGQASFIYYLEEDAKLLNLDRTSEKIYLDTIPLAKPYGNLEP